VVAASLLAMPPKTPVRLPLNKPPGPVNLAVTVVALVVLVLAAGHWWPAGNGWFLAAGPAVLVLLVCGGVWAIRSLYVTGQDQRWSWWIAPWPLVVALGVSAALVVRPGFTDARPQFEAIAQQALAAPGLAQRDGSRTGRFEIDRVRETSFGEVFFVSARGTGFNTQSGWVYSPNGTPHGFDDFTATPLGGPWYSYTAVWRD
jgi:hypothetical protein